VHQEGEIVIRSNRVMSYTDTALFKQSLLPGGWYKSGDIGYITDSGCLVLTSRIKRIISRGGEKISPVEIENVLLRTKGFLDVFVLGVPDELYGEQVCAAFVKAANEHLDIGLVKNEVGSALSKFKVPAYFIEVPAFPLTPSGKIDAILLKDMVMERIPAN